MAGVDGLQPAGAAETRSKYHDPYWIHAWLASRPMTYANESVPELIDEFIELIASWGATSVYSNEMRTYTLTPSGRKKLRDRAQNGIVNEFRAVISDANWADGFMISHAHAALTMNNQVDRSYGAAHLEITMTFHDRDSQLHAAREIANLVKRWFVALGASAAFVSDSQRDDPSVTQFEGAHRLPSVMVWPAIGQFLRGVFWGMGLGPELCSRLGGSETILASAPVAVAQALGDGVWLQLSEHPPADLEDVKQLSDYLSPLLQWTEEDYFEPIRRGNAEAASGAAHVPPESQPGGTSSPQASTPNHAAPLHYRPDWEQDSADVVLNIHVNLPLSAELESSVIQVLNEWYEYGFDESTFGGGFHFLDEPSIDRGEAVIRTWGDLGSALPSEALEDLAVRLGRLGEGVVQMIVIGIERVD